MKNLLIVLMLSFSIGLSAQVLNQAFNGVLSPIVQSGGSGSNFDFQGLFQNSLGQFAGIEAPSNNMILVMADGGKCYSLPITSIVAGSIITGTVNDPSGDLSALPSGVAFIGQKTQNKSFILEGDLLPDELKTCIENHFRLAVDGESTNGIEIKGTFKSQQEAAENNVQPDELFEADWGSKSYPAGVIVRKH